MESQQNTLFLHKLPLELNKLLVTGLCECHLLWGDDSGTSFVVGVFLDLREAIFALLERYRTFVDSTDYHIEKLNTYDKDKDLWTFNLSDRYIIRYWISTRKFGEIYPYDWIEQYFIRDNQLIFMNNEADYVKEINEIGYNPLKSFLKQLEEYNKSKN